MAPTTKKRAAKYTAGPPRKRGRPSNATKKEQKTVEETIDNVEEGVEEDEAVVGQIDGEMSFLLLASTAESVMFRWNL